MRIVDMLLSRKYKKHIDNASIILAVSVYLFLVVFAVRFCFGEEQADNSSQLDITAYSHNSRKPLSNKKEIGNYGLKDLSGRLLLDRYVEITQGMQIDKYLELVGISTPTATLQSNHAELWLNNTAKQLCVRFDDTSSNCLASAGSLSGYLTTSSATTTYLQNSSATATYLSIGSAASTYLTQTNAATTYGALNGTNTWTGGNQWVSSRRSTFTVAPALLNLTNTVLATDSQGVIVSTTISGSSGAQYYFSAASQTVQATAFTTTSNTFQTTNLVLSITPTSSAHRVKITMTGNMSIAAAIGINGQVTIFRGSTNLAVAADTDFCRIFSAAAQTVLSPCSITFIDSPATTSATTYSVKLKNDNGATTVGFGTNEDQVMILEEVL